MPIYEYYCEDCQKKFEALRSMSKADDPIECEYCEGLHTTRKLSLFAAHSGGKAIAGAGGAACGTCAGGSCATCGMG